MDAATVTALGLAGVGSASAAWAPVYGRIQARSSTRALEQTERARREQAEPYVVVDIRQRAPHSSVLVLAIENTGPTMARDVRIQIDPPLRSSLGAEREAALARVVARPIPSLPPGRRYIYIIDIAFKLFDSGLPTVYTAKVDCTGPFGAVEELTYIIDLDVLRDGNYDSESAEANLDSLATSLKKVVAALDSQSTTLSRLEHHLAAEARKNEPPPT